MLAQTMKAITPGLTGMLPGLWRHQGKPRPGLCRRPESRTCDTRSEAVDHGPSLSTEDTTKYTQISQGKISVE